MHNTVPTKLDEGGGERMSELKPCPFCGGEAELVEHEVVGYQTDFYVECVTSECIMCMGGLCYPTENEAIEAWNRRAET